MGLTRDQLPSRTSLWAAAARAVGHQDPDPATRNPDWVARLLMDTRERQLIVPSALAEALGGDYDNAMTRPEVIGAVRYHLQRTRFVDEYLATSLAGGASQVVILGAGLDSRAIRFENGLAHLPVFEVDGAAAQAHKGRRIRAALGRPLPHVRFVPADITGEGLETLLQEHGYSPQSKTAFIFEGVSMYLSRARFSAVLRFVATQSGPGSSIAFDYFTDTYVRVTPRRNAAVRALFDMVEAWGEPICFGASNAALENLLLSYADETEHAGRIRVHIVDPGATATRMRQLAFPGEEPASLKQPATVADAIVAHLQSDAPTGSRFRVEG